MVCRSAPGCRGPWPPVLVPATMTDDRHAHAACGANAASYRSRPTARSQSATSIAAPWSSKSPGGAWLYQDWLVQAGLFPANLVVGSRSDRRIIEGAI